MGGLIDAALLSLVAWAIIAVAAGVGLVVAAMTLVRRAREGDYDLAAGYNAMAPYTEH